jgi:ketosteroid isomerase-like protein
MLWLGTAVHSVVERVSIQTDQGERAGYVIATNVFVKTAQGWRLVSHHASPGSPQEAGEAAEFPSTLH